MLFTLVRSNNSFKVFREGDGGKPTGESLGDFDSRIEAENFIGKTSAAEGKVLTSAELKNIKCGMEMAYVPWGVTTLKDALAAEEAQDEAREIQDLGQMYKQIVDNILGSPDIKDKARAITALADEFASQLSDTASGDNEKSFDETDSEKAVRYLVPDGKHLPVSGEDGKLDHHLMGAAWAALHDGYRGNKYGGPDKEKAIAKLKKLYKQEGMDTPKSIPDYMLIKSLGNNRVGSYAVLWGSETKKDLTEEYFDQKTEELTAIFDAVGRLPYIYHHALDETLKTRVTGVIDVLKPDSIGLWYEAQLKMADEYDAQIKQMILDNKLKTSSQTFPAARRVSKSGHIERWPIIEISATPTPAEYRMQPVEFLKTAYAEIGGDLDGIIKRYEEDKTQGAEKARALLQLQRQRFISQGVI